MIDLAFETLVPVSDAGKLNILPAKPNGKRVHKATVCRWAKHGLGGVRLETVRVGGSRYTSAEALLRFFQRLSEDRPAAAQPPAAPPAAGTPTPDRLTGRMSSLEVQRRMGAIVAPPPVRRRG